MARGYKNRGENSGGTLLSSRFLFLLLGIKFGCGQRGPLQRGNVNTIVAPFRETPGFVSSFEKGISPWVSSCSSDKKCLMTELILRRSPEEILVAVEPSQPLEGQDVTLTPGGKPDFLVCSWYRGGKNEPNRIFTYIPSSHEQQYGTNFTGRETAGPGCSLHIRNLMLNDTGDYIVSKIDGNFILAKPLPSEWNRTLNIPDVSRDDAGTYTCQVWKLANNATSNPSKIAVTERLFPPLLWPAELFVEEHANVTLNCTTSERSGITVSWFKDRKAVPAKAVLSEQNRALTIPDVSRDDEGMYTCEAMSNPSKIAVTRPHSTLAAGAVSAIVLGPLAVAALAGTLLYCFFRARSRKNKNSKQMNPSSPVYENTGPSVQVVPVNSSEISNTYEELQHGSQAVYDQLRW
ncbi:UNVERIFIED_CONTAM: hypothetical protein K2H54_031742 [Gekko kuhli]